VSRTSGCDRGPSASTTRRSTRGRILRVVESDVGLSFNSSYWRRSLIPVVTIVTGYRIRSVYGDKARRPPTYMTCPIQTISPPRLGTVTSFPSRRREPRAFSATARELEQSDSNPSPRAIHLSMRPLRDVTRWAPSRRQSPFRAGDGGGARRREKGDQIRDFPRSSGPPIGMAPTESISASRPPSKSVWSWAASSFAKPTAASVST
jgi:hypothetical protein